MENILDLAEIRKKFHQNPETCWTEFWTTAEICTYLESFGYKLMIGKEIIQPDLRENVPDSETLDKWYQNAIELGSRSDFLEKMKGGLTGVIGILDTGKPGPTIAFRADIDALPIKESKRRVHRPAKEGWRSKYEGKMHSCGHDVHLTIGLGIAEHIYMNKESLEGKYFMIFSPAEEGGKGCISINKLPIIQEIDYILTFHDATMPLGGNHFIVPRIFFRSADTYKVEFTRGKSSGGLDVNQFSDTIQTMKIKSTVDVIHEIVKAMSSIPNKENDAVMAACMAIINIKAIPRKPNGHSLVQITGLYTGEKDEMKFGLADPCSFTILIRGADDEIGEYMKKNVLHILESAASLYDVKVSIEKTNDFSYPAWNGNSPKLINLAIDTWKEMGMGENYIKYPFGELGSDDVIYIMKEVVKNGGHPIYIGLVSDDDSGRMKNIHTDRFDFKDDLLIKGVDLITRMIKKIINEK